MITIKIENIENWMGTHFTKHIQKNIDNIKTVSDLLDFYKLYQNFDKNTYQRMIRKLNKKRVRSMIEEC